MSLDLAAQLATDRSAHMDQSGAGIDVALTGPSATVRCLFQDESSSGDREGPYAWILDADVTTAGATHGSTVTIDSRNFTVDGRQADGYGWTMLVLQSQ